MKLFMGAQYSLHVLLDKYYKDQGTEPVSSMAPGVVLFHLVVVSLETCCITLTTARQNLNVFVHGVFFCQQ